MKFREDGKRLSRALRKKIKQLQDFTHRHRSGPTLDANEIRNQVRKYGRIIKPTIFQREEDYQRIGEWVISVLCDCSGSMSGDKMRYAKQALATVAVALNDLPHVKFELYGFTDDYVDDDANIIDIKIKEYNETFSVSQLKDLTSYYGNCDGYNIRTAIKRMEKYKGKKRVIVVISDGQPAYGNGMEDTTNVVARAEEQGIKVIGVGIPGVNEQQLAEIYTQDKRRLVIEEEKNLDELPEKLALMILEAIDDRTQQRFVKRSWED